MIQKNYVILPHAFQILVLAKKDLVMQKLDTIKPGVDALKWADILALIKPGLKALIRPIMKTQKLCSMKPSG